MSTRFRTGLFFPNWEVFQNSASVQAQLMSWEEEINQRDLLCLFITELGQNLSVYVLYFVVHCFLRFAN